MQIDAADGLSDADPRLDRGACFASIVRTCNHVFRDGALWLVRFAGDERPEVHMPTSCGEPSDQATYGAALLPKVRGLDGADLNGSLGGGERRISRPRWVCAVHLSDHQTHHRGQIHAMLTAAGAEPAPTDLIVLPDLP